LSIEALWIPDNIISRLDIRKIIYIISCILVRGLRMMIKKSAVLALGISMLILGSCGKKEHSAMPENSVPLVKGAALEVARSQSLDESFEAAGTVRSRTSAIVSPRIAGVITVMNAREGARVRKGEILAQLDARENQANAAAAAGAVEDARRAVDESIARKSFAEAQFNRYQKLFKSDAVSRQEFEIKETEKELAQQGLARAEARLNQMQEQSKGAGAFADYTKITAPISGVITSRQADLGATVFPGQPVFTIEDESGYQLELAIPESLALKVRPGTVAQVTLDAMGSSFVAKVTEIVPSADPLSRTFTAKIFLQQKGLKSGMFGRGVISQGTTVKGMTLPKKAVVERGALTSVWVLEKENIARMRIVKVGKQLGERVEILSGLSDGERVVVSEVEKVSEGAKVE
jgi:membrane fusion protein, multidrug efflux system